MTIDEQFDRWLSKQTARGIFKGGCSFGEEIIARAAWKASREAITIELPVTPNRGIGYGLYDAAKEDIRQVLEAAGLKVTG